MRLLASLPRLSAAAPALAGFLLAAAVAAQEPGAPSPAPELAPPPAPGSPSELPPGVFDDGAPPAPADRAGGDHHPGKGAPESIETLLERLADEDASDPQFVLRRIGELWSRSGSDSMDLLLARGREAIDGEDYEKALAHLSALNRLAPDFAEGWHTRATALFLKEDYWGSVAAIQRVLALEPRHFGALSGLGVILEQTGDETEALAAHREALRINPHLEGSRDAVKRLAPQVDGRDI